MHEYRSFAALGDSFTEGVGDLCADGVSCRGWADRFAEHLVVHRPGLRYANLAIRGKLLGEVLDEQVPTAISLGPDLVSLAAGGNDMLRPRTDPDALAVTFEAAVAKLTAAGCTVMAFTGFDPKAFPVIRLIRGKAAVFSMHVRVIAAKYDCLLADLWPMRILTDRRLWSPDRLHMAADGHRRVALLACEVAGLPVADDWRAPLTAQPIGPGTTGAARSWLSSRWSDVEWVTEHAAPYLSRRLHGISAGDGMAPKRPELAAFGEVSAVAPAPPEPRPSSDGALPAEESEPEPAVV
jgi:lysophospholipase L1-like esterase